MSFNHWKALSTSELPPVIQCTASPERLKLLHHKDNQRCPTQDAATERQCLRTALSGMELTLPLTEMSASPSVSYKPFSDDASLCLCQEDQGNSVIKNKLHRVPLRLSYVIGKSRTHRENTSKRFGVPEKIKWLCL